MLRTQVVFELDEQGSQLVAKLLRAVRGPDAVGTTPAECRRITPAALHDIWHVRAAQQIVASCRCTHPQTARRCCRSLRRWSLSAPRPPLLGVSSFQCRELLTFWRVQEVVARFSVLLENGGDVPGSRAAAQLDHQMHKYHDVRGGRGQLIYCPCRAVPSTRLLLQMACAGRRRM